MRRALLVLFLALWLLIAGLASLDGRLLALALPLLAYFGVALYYSPGPPRLRVHRELGASAIVEGDDVEVTLTLVNDGPPIEQIVVEDRSTELLPTLGGAPRVLAALPAGESLTLRYTLRTRRGVFDLADTRVVVGEALGAITLAGQVAASGRLVVLPPAARLRPLAISPRRTLSYAGPIPSRQGGSGVTFFGLREYHAGDPLRRINWRVTARHGGNPFSTEFEQERTADVGLILDMRRQSDLEVDGQSLLDHGIRATAALADTLLRQGHRVGLLLYGRGLDWVFPGYGGGQRGRIMRALTAAEPSDSVVFESLRYLPTRLFPARSQLIFVSPLEAEDRAVLFRLRAYGYSILVVSPDPVSFEGAGLPEEPTASLAVRLAGLERALFLQQLRQGGVAVVNWPVERSLDELLYTALKRRFAGGERR